MPEWTIRLIALRVVWIVAPIALVATLLGPYAYRTWAIGDESFPPVPDGYGDVATVRSETGLFFEAPVPYFVFIHPAGRPDERDNLVFQYSGTDATAPRITWISRFAVKIAVDEPGEISLLRSYAGSISISYALGHEVR